MKQVQISWPNHLKPSKTIGIPYRNLDWFFLGQALLLLRGISNINRSSYSAVSAATKSSLTSEILRLPGLKVLYEGPLVTSHKFHVQPVFVTLVVMIFPFNLPL